VNEVCREMMLPMGDAVSFSVLLRCRSSCSLPMIVAL
jgi:hypothetical protein